MNPFASERKGIDGILDTVHRPGILFPGADAVSQYLRVRVVMKYFITGGAGFIGSNLCDRLLANGNSVVVYDNLSTGRLDFLSDAAKNPAFTSIQGDVLNSDVLKRSISGCDFVFHLSANADVRYGLLHPDKDIQQNTIGTFNVLEAMRANSINSIVFSSSGSVYGDAAVFPTPEQAPFPVQTSLYGASKLAGEGLITSYCEGYGFKAWIFRFVSILGERYSHGHVFDFYAQLLKDPDKLHILGDGHQKKSYLYVQDCISAMLAAINAAGAPLKILNLGTEEYCEVIDSAKWICAELNLTPRITFSGGTKGWTGDSPLILLDISRIKGLGWSPKYKIKESVIRTIQYLKNNQWLFKEKS